MKKILALVLIFTFLSVGVASAWGPYCPIPTPPPPPVEPPPLSNAGFAISMWEFILITAWIPMWYAGMYIHDKKTQKTWQMLHSLQTRGNYSLAMYKLEKLNPYGNMYP